MDVRYGRVKWGHGSPRERTSAENWAQPLRWNRAAAALGQRHRVFCASLADVFDSGVDPSWRNDLWRTIRSTSALDWLLLTKRPENMLPEIARLGLPQNVWLGTSIENQTRAEERLPILARQSSTIRFASVEPLLGPVNLAAWLHTLDWVIVGGESGPGARPMNPDWVIAIRDQCAAAGVAFFFKQWGGVRKGTTGGLLEGRIYDELPHPNTDWPTNGVHDF
jgi:protein gp37